MTGLAPLVEDPLTEPPNVQERCDSGGERCRAFLRGIKGVIDVNCINVGSLVEANALIVLWCICVVEDIGALFGEVRPCPTSTLNRVKATHVRATAGWTWINVLTRVGFYFTGLLKEMVMECLCLFISP